MKGATQDGKVYGYPLWFYGFCNYINTKQFKEVGLDPDKDWPQDWKQFGEVAKRLTIRDGNKFTRQGFKFAMHAAQWTMIQFNPILITHGGQWFDASGKCTVNNEAGVKAMTARASLARQYGAEDPADSIATNPLPQMDWLKERCSMFWCHPIPPAAIKSQNQTMLVEGYFRPVQYPGVEPGKGISTTYGFNLVVNARAPKDKQEALQDLYKFIMSDLVDCWKDTAPFTLGRKSGWADNPAVKEFPHVARDHQGEGPGRVPAAHRRLHRAGRRHASRRAEDHAHQRRHQGDARRGSGGGRPGVGGLQEGMTSGGSGRGPPRDGERIARAGGCETAGNGDAYAASRPSARTPCPSAAPGALAAALQPPHPALGRQLRPAHPAVLRRLQVRTDGVGGGAQLHFL